nr:MAG TPA: hypothetical protein [Caudoviricetes sp.]
MRPVVLALIDFLNEGFRTPNFIEHHNLIYFWGNLKWKKNH